MPVVSNQMKFLQAAAFAPIAAALLLGCLPVLLGIGVWRRLPRF
jgi:hypothetical protein